MRTAGWVLVGIGVVACSKETPPPPPAPAPSASAEPAAPPPPALDFHVVARGPEGMTLSDVEPTNLLLASNLVFSISEAKLRQAPELGRKAPKSFVAAGHYPDTVWMSARVPNDENEGEHTVSYKWTSAGWEKTSTLRDGETFAGIAPWTDQRTLALIRMNAYDVRFALVGGKGPVALPAPAAYKPPKEEPKGEPKAAAPEQPTATETADAAASGDAAGAESDAAGSTGAADAAPSETPPSGPDEVEATSESEEPQGVKCKTAVHLPQAGPEPLRTLVSLRNGEVVRVGYECRADEEHVLALERWAPKQRKSELETLPKDPALGVGAPVLLARGGDELQVVVLGAKKAWLTQRAGGKWLPAKLPFAAPIVDADVSPDGALFLATEKALFRQETAGGPFVEIPVPELTAIARVYAAGKDDVWLVGREAAGSTALLHTRPPATVVDLPRADAVAGMQKSNKRSPATAACDSVYVHIQTLGLTGAKPPASFPKLAEAIKSDAALAKVEPVIEDDGANTYLGAKAPSLALAEKLAKALNAKDKRGAGAQIFCHQPRVKNKTPLKL